MVNIENFQPIELKELEWTSENNEVIALRTVLDGFNTNIRFSATDLKQQYTGLHGKIRIWHEGYTVASDYINISKMMQRNSLAKFAYEHPLMADVSNFYTRQNMHIDLTTFADNVFDKYVEIVDAEDVIGDPLLEVGEWIKNIAPCGGGVILSGLPKRGKSFLAMAMAVSVDAGCSEIWNVKQGPALYVNLERSQNSMIKRLGCVNKALNLPAERPLAFLNVRGHTLSSIKNNLKQIIKARGIKFIVLDSISRAGEGSLVEDKTALAVTDTLNSLIEESDCSWLAIAHRGYSNEHTYGSIHFVGAADVILATESVYNANKDLGIKIISEGQNDLPPLDSPVIKLEFDDWGLKTMSHSSEDEYPDFKDDIRAAKDKIRDYLLSNGKQPVANIESELGLERNTVNATLSRNKNMFQKFGGFWGVKA